ILHSRHRESEAPGVGPKRRELADGDDSSKIKNPLARIARMKALRSEAWSRNPEQNHWLLHPSPVNTTPLWPFVLNQSTLYLRTNQSSLLYEPVTLTSPSRFHSPCSNFLLALPYPQRRLSERWLPAHSPSSGELHPSRTRNPQAVLSSV